MQRHFPVKTALGKRKRSLDESDTGASHCRWVASVPQNQGHSSFEYIRPLQEDPRFRESPESYTFWDARTEKFLAPCVGVPGLATLCQPGDAPLILNPPAIERVIQMLDADLFAANELLRYISGNLDKSASAISTMRTISQASTIYRVIPVAMLTCDPFEKCQAYELRRVLGTVGRPGITLLVPPDTPLVRKADPSSWKILSTNHFNGCAEDHLTRTSDHNIHFLESVISVYDSGIWVGDIDILKALGNLSCIQLLSCKHSQTEKQQGSSSLWFAGTWDDIPGPPKESFIVRANNNWTARLATVAVVFQVHPMKLLRHVLMICAVPVSMRISEEKPAQILPGITYFDNCVRDHASQIAL
ncbi:hypothetical protein BBP40_011994 [Aspergillus hancockii]|nr:hypothetical protein BBP40_011994 [Aspergillus hancockii]